MIDGRKQQDHHGEATVTEDQQCARVEPAAERRTFPPCECPRDCGGRPEARLRLTSTYPPVTSAGALSAPPAVPYVPRQVGEIVLDVLSGRIGRYMDRLGKSVFLRPESGGPEWEADPGWIDRPPGRNSGTAEPV